MILVDTSVWIDHLKRGSNRLSDLLDQGRVLIHPFIIGELACGNLKNRDEILSLFSALPVAHMAEHPEVMQLVNSYSLYGLGLGWIDMHLLASALLTHCNMWTKDRRLVHGAAAVGIPGNVSE